MKTPQWDGRDVKFVDFDIATGEAVIAKAMAGEHTHAMYLTVVASARFVDDDTPVFASVEDLRALPFRLLVRVRMLASLAADQNGLGAKPDDDEDADPLDGAGASVSAPARSGAWENGR